MKDKEPIIIEEPYTCVSCGKQNLKFDEISYKEDEDGQIDLKTVQCWHCGWLTLWPTLEKMVIPGHEKDVERVLKKVMKGKAQNYNRRLVRRATKGRKE